jgi:hypothetical protein
MNKEIITKLSDGNIGAAIFLIEMLKDENIIYADILFEKLDKCPTIIGTNLYVLWNDLCEQKPFLVACLCKLCPDDILIDACSRQDRSGKKLIEPYLK